MHKCILKEKCYFFFPATKLADKKIDGHMREIKVDHDLIRLNVQKQYSQYNKLFLRISLHLIPFIVFLIG